MTNPPSANGDAMSQDAGMDPLVEQRWNREWDSLRSRRIAALVSIVALVAIWIALGPIGLLLGFALLAGAYWNLRRWPCPRCHLPIVGAGFRTFITRCVNCHLLIFGHPDDLSAEANIDAAGMRLSPRVRRAVASYEMFVGASFMIMTPFFRAAWWYTLFLEGLAGISLGAGIWLWRDDRRGYALSRTLQIAQIVRIRSPFFVYTATAGLYLDLFHGVAPQGSQVANQVGIQPGFWGSFLLSFGGGQPLSISVNFWAMLLLLVLTQARPAFAPDARAEVDLPGGSVYPVT